jgi:hypothetical protein
MSKQRKHARLIAELYGFKHRGRRTRWLMKSWRVRAVLQGLR